MERVIKWQTGTPEKRGLYIVTNINNRVVLFIFNPNLCAHRRYFECWAKAWFKLSDVKPYKE